MLKRGIELLKFLKGNNRRLVYRLLSYFKKYPHLQFNIIIYLFKAEKWPLFSSSRDTHPGEKLHITIGFNFTFLYRLIGFIFGLQE